MQKLSLGSLSVWFQIGNTASKQKIGYAKFVFTLKEAICYTLFLKFAIHLKGYIFYVRTEN
jgi:hypothetical protein